MSTPSRVPLTLRRVDRDQAFTIEESNADSGVIASWGGSSGPLPERGQRLVLEAEDPRMATVRFYVEVIGYADSTGRTLVVQWVLLTARQRRAYLIFALQEVLGLNARLMSEDDALGPHRKLVYQASQQQVRLINVGEPIEGDAGVPATPSLGQPRRRGLKTTQPRILVRTGEQPTLSDIKALPED